jgi:hypothetical protein
VETDRRLLEGAVVEIAFQPPALGVTGRHEAFPRVAQPADLHAQLGFEALVLQCDRRRGADAADELGRVAQAGIVASSTSSRARSSAARGLAAGSVRVDEPGEDLLVELFLRLAMLRRARGDEERLLAIRFREQELEVRVPDLRVRLHDRRT